MSVIRRVAAASAAAAFLTVGFASSASAELLPTEMLTGAGDAQTIAGPIGGLASYSDSSSLLDISDNNVGPFQVCNNEVIGNGIGGTVTGSGIAGILSDDNTVLDEETCDQVTAQLNEDSATTPTWFSVEDDGSLIRVRDNNVGPLQACNNDVPINVIGGLVPIDGFVGILSDDNTTELIKPCKQNTVQDN